MDKPVITLPVWLTKGERVNRLKQAAEHWWENVKSWLEWALDQQDPQKCSEQALEKLAWHRQIKRIQNESLEMFRKRVAFAFANAVDAGSQAGFLRIIKRLDLPVVAVIERQQPFDWDQIEIVWNGNPIALNEQVLQSVIRTYGRTGRRYFVSTSQVAELNIQCVSVMFEQQNTQLRHKFNTPPAVTYSSLSSGISFEQHQSIAQI